MIKEMQRNIVKKFIKDSQVYFRFEQDFVEENIRCIPMIVRFKLDACGIKLQLKEWCKFSIDERNELCKRECKNSLDLQLYRNYLQKLVYSYTGKEATNLLIDINPEWAILNTIPLAIEQELLRYNSTISLQQWNSLGDLKRFVLMKLSKPGHENRNFPVALKEFGLV